MTERAPRRWLILSHAFNMDGRAASLTVTDKIPHLRAAGIEPVVYSAVTGTQDQRFEHRRLLPWGPSGLVFDLRHLVSRQVGRGIAYRAVMLLASLVLALPMLLERALTGLRSQWSWSVPAFLRGARRWRRGDLELVYSSGGAYSAHLAGWWLKRWCGARWIAEVHDPMVFPDRPPRHRDDRLQARLEALICRHADLAWWFTEGALEAARGRHPELGDRGIVVVPGAEPMPVHADYLPGPVCVLGHFGSLSESRSLAPFVRALDALLHQQPGWRTHLRLEVYGGDIDAPAQALIRASGLADVVLPMGRLERDPVSGRSGRERVLERMQQVDVLLLLHGDTAECAQYIPSKLYDYFWARRPVLALTHRNPQLDALVRAHDGQVAPTLDTPAVVAALTALLDRWAGAGLAAIAVPPVGVRQAVQRLIAEVDARHA
ncbi:MAG: hypothetical protein ABIQ60_08415 [Burkholderiaceae bacterium]